MGTKSQKGLPEFGDAHGYRTRNRNVLAIQNHRLELFKYQLFMILNISTLFQKK